VNYTASRKILVTDADTVVHNGDISLDFLNEFGAVTCYGSTEANEIIPRLNESGADILICNKTPITANVIRSCDKLKYIGLFATGYNNIDIDAAKSRGITVCNAPGYSTFAVVQHTFALLLELVSRVRDYRLLVDEGDWIKSRTFSHFPLPLTELYGKTMGIVGFGAIGRRAAAAAQAFGMKVVVYTRTKPDSPPPGIAFAERDELFSAADVISLHCPLNPGSENMINQQTLRLFKPTAYLINTARGALIDEDALYAALSADRLAGAGVDVLRSEPMNADNRLRLLKNCVITPHVAWAPIETRRRLTDIVAANLRAYLGGKPINVVN
jgi:glycerate dehydrogenase